MEPNNERKLAKSIRSKKQSGAQLGETTTDLQASAGWLRMAFQRSSCMLFLISTERPSPALALTESAPRPHSAWPPAPSDQFPGSPGCPALPRQSRCFGHARDLRIGKAHGFAIQAPLRPKPCAFGSRRGVERQGPLRKDIHDLCEHIGQPPEPSSGWQYCNSEGDFVYGDGGNEQPGCRLPIQPLNDALSGSTRLLSDTTLEANRIIGSGHGRSRPT